MGKHVEPHIKKMNPKTAPLLNKGIAVTIAAGLAGSGNPAQVSQGLLVTSASGAVQLAVTDNNAKKLASKTATNTMNTSNKDLCTVTNAAAVIVEQLHPNDPDYWRAEGWTVTEEVVPDTVQAGQAEHCSAVQSDNLGDVLVHNTPVWNADSYRDLVTKGPVADRSQYIDVTNYEDGANTSSSRTVHMPTDYLDVPVNFITITQNSLGAGVESVPYGGGRKFQ